MTRAFVRVKADEDVRKGRILYILDKVKLQDLTVLSICGVSVSSLSKVKPRIFTELEKVNSLSKRNSFGVVIEELLGRLKMIALVFDMLIFRRLWSIQQSMSVMRSLSFFWSCWMLSFLIGK